MIYTIYYIKKHKKIWALYRLRNLKIEKKNPHYN